MPTQIVAGKSNPQDGIINKQDLDRITQDFENFVDIKSSISREFKKMNEIFIPIPIIEHLISKLDPAEKLNSKLKIKFGITLPDQKDCKDVSKDISDHLTIVVFLSKGGIDLLDRVDDFVITPGFKELGGGNEGACCPLIHP